jgi:HAMP domain-containing protein
MTHLLRIIGMTALTLLLIGAAFALGVSGAVLSDQSVRLDVAGVGGQPTMAMSDPCVSAARWAEVAGRAAVC